MNDFRNPRLCLGLAFGLIVACSAPGETPNRAEHEAAETVVDAMKGPHGGRLLTSGDFELELAIFENNIPPEFRAWATKAGRAVAGDEVLLTVRLTRLGGIVEEVSFSPAGDFLRGNALIYEPHSFDVSIEASHARESYQWSYENYEGRTRIPAAVAESLGIETAIAGEAVISDAVEVYGRILPNRERVRELRARFDGVVRAVHAGLGSKVTKGDKLLSIESNESLNRYTVSAPIGGVVTQRDANPGEQTSDRVLMTITDPSSVWVELSVFPTHRERIHVGSAVTVTPAGGGEDAAGTISAIDVVARSDQSVVARAVLDNPDGALVPGTFVSAEITVGEHRVPLAVRRESLQSFRDFSVVFAQIGEEYEVRMLELGRRSDDWVEVLGGLDPGTRYVTANSFVIKADIEKSGASHDH
ncbi:MAG: HlyD family efflux transporter periplasmic adaptor subunit [Myxococcales bacterium]|nr:HlyD family efflux transporter periplasmic adaptor subunit [Myxococcales bacterium]